MKQEIDHVWHANTSPITYDGQLHPLRDREGNPVICKTAIGEEVHAVFASGGDFAEQGAYAYALKLPKIYPTEEEKAHSKATQLPIATGSVIAVNFLPGAVFVLIDSRELFEERLDTHTGHIYKLDARNFRNTAGTEFICEGPATILERIDISGKEALTTVMENKVQIAFVKDTQALKQYYESWQEISNIKEKDHAIKAVRKLLYQMIENEQLIHLNQEMNINPIGKHASKLPQSQMLHKELNPAYVPM